MRRLSVFVLSLATVLALASVTQAGKKEGTPGRGPKGDDDGPLRVSQFSAPLLRIRDPETPFARLKPPVEIPVSLAEINTLGDYSFTTTQLVPGYYEICLDAISRPGPVLLVTIVPNDINEGAYSANGRMHDENGNWQAPSFQVRIVDIGGDDCTGPIIQESGINITGSGVSKFSAPFVAIDPFSGDVENDPLSGEIESTAQISKSGYWILATSDLKRRQRYDICLFFDDPGGNIPFQFLFLADKKSERSGNFYAKGNAYDRFGSDDYALTLRAPSFQIMEEPRDGAGNCAELHPAQETGLFIDAPAP